MIKRICCLLIGVLCVLMFAACGTQGGDNSGENLKSQNSEVDILKEIETANSNENLIAKYNKMAYRYTYMYADGTIDSAYCYIDADRYVCEYKDYVFIDENGDGYGFDDVEKKAFRNLYVENSYEENVKKNTAVANFAYFGDMEQIISQEEKDGIITICTKVEDDEYIKDYTATYLYEEGDVTGIESVYDVDAETYELLSMRLFVVLTDGTKEPLFEHVRVSNPETYVVDEQLTELVNGKDTRTVTVIAYPGTEQEKTYIQTIAKGHMVIVYLPADGEQVLYTDAECTTVYEGGADLNANLTVYYK